MDPCLNGVHGTECGTGNGRGNTVLREREHRSRMDDLRRREEVNRNFFQTFENVSKRFAKKFLKLFYFQEAKRRQREARDRLDRLEKERQEKRDKEAQDAAKP